MRSASACLLALLVALLTGCPSEPSTPDGGGADAGPTPPARSWELLATPAEALMGIHGSAPDELWAVGADKGAGPLVLRFDGSGWRRVATGTRGDLWWVHTLGGERAFLGGAEATVLRFEGGTFTRMATPGFGRQTVYGIWASGPSDIWAVGGAAGREGFLWHSTGGAFTAVALPADLPRRADGELPALLKVWGDGQGAVWVVGDRGTVLKGGAGVPFVRVLFDSTDRLFTVSGAGGRVVVVGGSGNGLLAEGDGAGLSAVTLDGSPLLQGVSAREGEAVAVGQRGTVWSRRTGGWGREAGVPAIAAESLHAVHITSTGEVFAVGGNVLSASLDKGVLLHGGARSVAPVPVPDAGADGGVVFVCPAEERTVASDKSMARQWNEMALASIRRDLPRPVVHSRNLFHLAGVAWDAWAAWDSSAAGQLFTEKLTAIDPDAARSTAIAFASYRLLTHRYGPAIGGGIDRACFDARMSALGLDASDTHATGNDPIAVGNRIGAMWIAAYANDGANEAGNYADPSGYTPHDRALVVDEPGNASLQHPAFFQLLNLSVAATQNGIVLPAGEQKYIGSQWGAVKPFALKRGPGATTYFDLNAKAPGFDLATMGPWLVELIRRSSQFDPADTTTIDLSPGAYGGNSLGTNDGHGTALNPVTNQPYAPNPARRGDFGRVLAEHWADGPKSETPPGHWFAIANRVADDPRLERKLFGQGPALGALAWDVHLYLPLGGAVHDAAIAAWEQKRVHEGVRPISLIRWMGANGQSSDPSGPAYSTTGLPLVADLIEVVTAASSAPGQRHAELAPFVGQVAIRAWPGEPGDRRGQVGGVRWVRARDWWPYQRRNFVTPAFPGFISGHSTFSRAAAEVMASVTGSDFFPGGLGEFTAPKDTYLQFESGPSAAVTLQWATYFDAADQAGQSRLWGGIHIQPDDFEGRRVGHEVGLLAIAEAKRRFQGIAVAP